MSLWPVHLCLKLKNAKKADLLIVANYYNVQVPYSAKIAELNQFQCAQLVEQGILPRPAVDAADALMAEVKAAEVAAMLAAGVEPGPVTDPLMRGGMTTDTE